MTEIKCSPGACSNMRIRALTFEYKDDTYIAEAGEIGVYKISLIADQWYVRLIQPHDRRPIVLWQYSRNHYGDDPQKYTDMCQVDYVRRIGVHLELVDIWED